MQEKKPCKNLKIRKVTIIGVIPSFAFQRAKYCALELHRKLPQKFPLPEIIGMLELGWSEKLVEWRQTLGREYWCLRRPVAVFFDGSFIGSDIELLKLTSIGNVLFDNVPRKDMSCLKNNFRKDYIAFLKKSKRVYCYLDICVDDVYIGTLTFQLYSDLLPRTCENFKTLCLGNKGSFLTYKGSRIHRIVKKGWLQGGDIQYKTGGGGFSIFCDPLEDECFGIQHDRKGVLSMATGGRHKNGSQFFITLSSTQWMNTNFVAFGQLIEGSKVLKTLESLETMYECPVNKIEIKSCGKLDLEDVEDIDAAYREESLPKKKPKTIETISEQIMRLIMEALTDALARKEYTPDVLDERDVASKMNIQLYFQGLYSIPQEIVEESARYFRNFRRVLLRLSKPSATEIVEVIMYDLMMAILTRMTNLDDIRETIGHELYQKMIGGIDMTLEMCKKSYVKRLVDQIVSTAESMVTLISKKLKLMKKKSGNLQTFITRMQAWVQSFVRQETFLGDPYHIAEKLVEKPPEPQGDGNEPYRPGFPIPCCEEKKEGDSVEQLDKENAKRMEKLKSIIPPADFCCLGTRLLDSEMTLNKLFSTCRYDLKRKPGEEKARLPLLEFIEISRFKLKWMRKQENTVRTAERICLDKRIRKWMEDVKYTPETCWIRDTVFEPDEVAIDHIEDIMYGAMTVGLLEMYYFYEQYLKICGASKKRKVLKLSVSAEDFGESGEESSHSKDEEKKPEGEPQEPFDETLLRKDEDEGEVEKKEEIVEDEEDETDEKEDLGEDMNFFKDEEEGEDDAEVVEKVVEKVPKVLEKESREEKSLPECKCGHPCCVCAFDPAFVTTLRSGSDGEEEGKKKKKLKADGTIEVEKSYDEITGDVDEDDEDDETVDEEGGEGKSTISAGIEIKKKTKPCPSGHELVDLNEIMAETVSLKPADIDIKSFKWLRSYILKQGCDLKTQFATQAHKWLEGDRFGYKGFFSKHSLVTRASLLSLSISLAELIKQENKFKVEIRNFIYDLWDLYFNEMFKEAMVEFPSAYSTGEEDEAENKEREEKERETGKEEKKKLNEEEEKLLRSEKGYDEMNEKEREIYDRLMKLNEPMLKEWQQKGIKDKEKLILDDICKELMEKTPTFDLAAFCARFNKDKPEAKSITIKSPDDEGKGGEESYSNIDFKKKSFESVYSYRSEIKSVSSRRTYDDSKKSRTSYGINEELKKSRTSLAVNEEFKKSETSNVANEDRKKSRAFSTVKVEENQKKFSTTGDEEQRKSRAPSEVNEGQRKSRTFSEAKEEQRKSRAPSEVNEGQRKSRTFSEAKEEQRKSRAFSEVNEGQRKSRAFSEVNEGQRKSRTLSEAKEEQRKSRAFSEVNYDTRTSKESRRKSTVSNLNNDDYEKISSFVKHEDGAGKSTGYKTKYDESHKTQSPKKGASEKSYRGKGDSEERKVSVVSSDSQFESSSEESGIITAYTNPFWVTFLTELTKQALAAMAKASVLPKRLYFKTEADTDFNEKMKEWFEFNAFNPKPTKGRELIDYIALHHRSLTNLEESARSYLRKKKYSGLINRCTRFESADDLANEILTDVVETAVKNTDEEEAETLELFLSSMIPTAIASTSSVTDSFEDQEFDFETGPDDEVMGEVNS